MTYNKNTWNPYNSSMTYDQNKTNGGVVDSDKLNNMETGISNNDINKVTDNKDGTIEVNGNSITPADDSAVVHSIPTLLPSGTDLNTVTSPGYYQIVGAINRPKNADDWTIYQVVALRSSLSNGVQTAFDTNGNAQSNRVWSGRGWSSWVSFADDSKVVHTSDMRKPASDVAGIEEVNAKQDKIGYTPADNSKVLHNVPTQVTGTDINTLLTGGYYQVLNGTNEFPGSDNWTIYQVIPISSENGVQIAYETNITILGMRSWNFGSGHIRFTSWTTFADDSKVAHLSGANNFDTTPTVNNNNLAVDSAVAHLASNNTLSGTNNFTGPIQHNGNSVGAHIQASNNDEDSAISDSTKGNSDDIYYWCED